MNRTVNRTLSRIAALVCTIALSACGGGGSSAAPASASVQPTVLMITEVVLGTGTQAVAGKSVSVNYTGWLYQDGAAGSKGTQFDSNVGKAALRLTLGANEVIAGFDQGVLNMKVGGKRTVIIPSNLGYGAAGRPPSIPGNAGLVFDIELVSVNN